MRKLFLGVLFFATLSNGQAQPLYRCGNTFSQTPCNSDAKPIYRCNGAPSQTQCESDAKTIALQAKPVDVDRVEAMKAACIQWLRTVPDWKDRDSLKFGSVVRGKFDVKTINGSSTVVVNYITSINGKNSYGAYIGEKPAVCYANEQETKILSGYSF
jgi:hypothetical protein